MKVGSQAVKVKFEFSDKRLALFGKGGGRCTSISVIITAIPVSFAILLLLLGDGL